MTAIDIVLALLLVVCLVWLDKDPVSRITTVLLLAAVCVGHDSGGLKGIFFSIALVLFLSKTVTIHREPSTGAPATQPGPRMSAHELMGLAEDIAKADRLRASTDRLDHVRSKQLMEMAVDQAAGPRRGL